MEIKERLMVTYSVISLWLDLIALYSIASGLKEYSVGTQVYCGLLILICQLFAIYRPIMIFKDMGEEIKAQGNFIEDASDAIVSTLSLSILDTSYGWTLWLTLINLAAIMLTEQSFKNREYDALSIRVFGSGSWLMSIILIFANLILSISSGNLITSLISINCTLDWILLTIEKLDIYGIELSCKKK